MYSAGLLANQQQAFLADPDRYAPALSGDDPVAAFDARTTIAGQRRYGVTYQQRIYLFESPETRAKFATNPQRYTSRVILAEQPKECLGAYVISMTSKASDILSVYFLQKQAQTKNLLRVCLFLKL